MICIIVPMYISLCSFLYPFIFIIYYMNTKFSYTITNIWSKSTFFMIKLLFIKNIRLYYNPKILGYNKTLFISNHVNKLDWIVIWMALSVLKKRNIIFNAKNSLFLYGNMFHVFNENTNFVFLKRNINYDYITLVNSCEKMKNMKEYISVLFPEGTTTSNKSNIQNINFLRSKNRAIEPYKNVITPKTKGFKIIMDNLSNDLDNIIDCTLKYSNKFDLISFIKCKRVCVDIYLDVIQKPNSDYENWLLNSFKDKDKKLDTGFNNEKYLTLNISFSDKYKNIMLLFLPWFFSKLLKEFKIRVNNTIYKRKNLRQINNN